MRRFGILLAFVSIVVCGHWASQMLSAQEEARPDAPVPFYIPAPSEDEFWDAQPSCPGLETVTLKNEVRADPPGNCGLRLVSTSAFLRSSPAAPGGACFSGGERV